MHRAKPAAEDPAAPAVGEKAEAEGQTKPEAGKVSLKIVGGRKENSTGTGDSANIFHSIF